MGTIRTKTMTLTCMRWKSPQVMCREIWPKPFRSWPAVIGIDAIVSQRLFGRSVARRALRHTLLAQLSIEDTIRQGRSGWKMLEITVLLSNTHDVPDLVITGSLINTNSSIQNPRWTQKSCCSPMFIHHIWFPLLPGKVLNGIVPRSSYRRCEVN